MKRIGRLLVIALTAMVLTILAHPRAMAADLTFVLVNDIDTIDGDKDRGGFARLAAVVKAERAAGKNVFFAHAGDSISPSLMSGFDKGAHIIELLNMTPPDFFVPGNHEFDFGKDVFLTRMSEAKFPRFAANLRNAGGEAIPGFEDTRMIELDGVRVGIIGITSDDAKVKSSPGDLVLNDAVKTAFAARRSLQEAGADFFVVLGHLGRREDEALFRSGAFDLILTGDDHDLLLRYDGRTAMVESSQNAHFVTAIDLAINVSERDGRRRVNWRPKFRVIDTADVAPDAEVAAKIDGYRKDLAGELDVVIARTDVELDSRRAAVRGGETVIGNLIADAMREAVKADVAITNGGGIRGNRLYAVGTPITRRDILAELPFGNSTVLLELSGKDIVEALENGVSEVADGGGRFPQVSGMTFSYDPNQAAGKRVANAMIAGAPLDPEKTYRLATNDFMARGGDGYGVFRKAKSVIGERHSKLMANDVMVHLRQLGTVTAKVEGRITVAAANQ